MLYGPQRDKTCLRDFQQSENSPIASLDMILSKKRITKVLISLCGCAGWSAPLLFKIFEDKFSHTEANITVLICIPFSYEMMFILF